MFYDAVWHSVGKQAKGWCPVCLSVPKPRARSESSLSCHPGRGDENGCSARRKRSREQFRFEIHPLFVFCAVDCSAWTPYLNHNCFSFASILSSSCLAALRPSSLFFFSGVRVIVVGSVSLSSGLPFLPHLSPSLLSSITPSTLIN